MSDKYRDIKVMCCEDSIYISDSDDNDICLYPHDAILLIDELKLWIKNTVELNGGNKQD